MSIQSSDPGHGHSPAAWTAVVIMLVAFVIGAFAFWFAMPWLVVGAAVLVVIGLIVGAVMAKAGYGVNGPKYASRDH
jgi:protein-S-isoprenylcysteine O-methyltransferase Ste14